MKVRIKFSKQGPIKFIGHLDMMRYFQKLMRRADIDIKYSEGYSPHQIMSFASPLGVGLTSNGEYMDIEVNSTEDITTLADRLNSIMNEGIRIISCHKLEDHAKNAMALMAAADYTVTFREGKEPENPEEFYSGLKVFYSQEHIVIMKKSKKGEREVDIRPLIYQMNVENSCIFMKLSAGSTDNLKPELVMEAYDQWRGKSCPPFAFSVQREEVYGNVSSEDGCNLVPLGHIGESLE